MIGAHRGKKAQEWYDMWRNFVKDRPVRLWTFSLLYLSSALVCAAAVLFPMSPAAPTELNALIGLWCVMVAAFVWLRRTLSEVSLHTFAVIGVLLAAAVVSQSATPGGAISIAYGYMGYTLWCAYAFPRRVAAAYYFLISSTFAIGLILSGLPGMVAPYVAVNLMVWGVGIVFGGILHRLRSQVATDQLTGLLNRHGLDDAARRVRATADRNKNPVVAALLDLDGFKQINDSRGHAEGDRILEDLGERWLQAVRDEDILARTGGDEFVLLLPGTTLEGADTVLKRIQNLGITCSVGAAIWEEGESLEACLERADHVLYENKAARKTTGAIDSDTDGRIPENRRPSDPEPVGEISTATHLH